ncbi:uncharacterized protein LOC141592895 isoform X2 [Silene latifolia]|uniref:uncharacterized protein LOC141592895 isoform X2 n=1 Tax=Silene latifolia TaxID=37657 RepID=UPI003D779567
MEATQTNMSSGCSNHAVSIDRCNQLAETSAYRGLIGAHPETKRRGSPSNNRFKGTVKLPDSAYHPQIPAPASPKGVSNCYVFKSRLQEYAQKVELPTPTYETIKEGPSHAPSFRSTVIVGGSRYDSLLGFYNRKAAEQSAAEVALMDLSASGDKKESISVPVHETGLCKNVLQEYAQKMNYAIPTYTCKKEGATGRSNLFSCTVDIGGIQYIGTAATSKKEAEIKAARTALLAIHSSRSVEGEFGGKNNYTVVPLKRKVPETSFPQEETPKPKKSKKNRYRNKRLKKTQPGSSDNQIQAQAENMAISVNNTTGFPTGDQNVQVAGDGQIGHCLESSAQVNGATNVVAHIGEPSEGEGDGTVQQEGDMNTGSGDTVVSLTDANSNNGPTNMTPMEASTMKFMNHEKVGNDDHDVDSITPLINTQAYQQVVLLRSDSRTEPGELGDGPTDAKALYLGVDPLEHLVAANASSLREESNTGISDAVRLDSRIEPGGLGDGPTAAKAVLPGVDPAEHVVATNASPLREESNTGISDAVRSDSTTEPGDSGDGPTDAKPLSPGVGRVDHVVAANASLLREETKVDEISAVDTVISCSDQTVNDADSNAQE